MPSGADNVLTIHTTDGTERFRIDSSGNVKVGSAATISPDGDLFVTGVCTATTLSGAASGLTGALPAISAANLTNVPAANITGTLPAISAANLTNVPAANVVGVHTSLNITGTTVVGSAVTISESGIEASGIGITCASINGTQIGGRRNIIINGAMEVSQRGTSFTATGDEYTIDRFEHRVGSSYNFDTTTTQSTDHPNGFKNSFAITPDSVVTPSGSENGSISLQLESQDLQQFAHGTSSAKPMTVSFYAKSATVNSGHVYAIQVRKFETSNNKKYVLRPFTVTDSWQRFSFSFIGDTATAIRDTTDVGIEMVWQLSCGPDDLVSETGTWTSSTKFQGISGQNNFMDNTNNQFFMTGVQLEVGSQATPFEHRSYQEEIQLCYRYYYKTQPGSGAYFGSGFWYNSSSFLVHVDFPVVMRTNVTALQQSGTADHYKAISNGTTYTCNSVPSYLGDADNTSQSVNFHFNSSGTQGQGGLARSGNASAYLAWDAEL